jgi:uncharacterized protein (UPF0548 family)/uncharacterized membrane protein
MPLPAGTIEAALQHVHALEPNFRDDPSSMIPQNGWNHVHSTSLLWREPAGDAFARARRALASFRFSDPRIVRAWFDRGAPLRDRRMVLELKAAAGVRLLCPVKVVHVRDEESAFGFAIDTLEGHIEQGREWFLLERDPATGEVRLRIEAAWRAAHFPSWWAWLGFELLGRRYQRAWHRLAHVRLRKIGLGAAADTHPPLRAFALRSVRPPGAGVQSESERIRRDRLPLAATIAALAGARSLAPPAMLATWLRRRGERVPLASPRLAFGLPLLALAELAFDKLPFVPSRTSPPPLVGRIASGAICAATLAERTGRATVGPALLGAAAAAAGTFATAHGRRIASRRLGATRAALAEDALVIGLGALVLRRLGA